MRDINSERVNNELNDYYGYKIELINRNFLVSCNIYMENGKGMPISLIFLFL